MLARNADVEAAVEPGMQTAVLAERLGERRPISALVQRGTPLADLADPHALTDTVCREMAGDEPIRVLRVIARLNVGGPALHVSYLTSELDKIGYETTLVTGTVGEDEGSMEYVVRERGIEPVYLPGLQREIAPVSDAHAVARAREA